jgi:hypothetical protein
MKLTIRKTWPDHPMRDNDFVVLLDGKSLARIMFCVRADFREVWEWSEGVYYAAARSQEAADA